MRLMGCKLILDHPVVHPVRAHAERPWMRGRAYHKRIQNKWNKRYGVKFDYSLKQGEVIKSSGPPEPFIVMRDDDFLRYRDQLS